MRCNYLYVGSYVGINFVGGIWNKQFSISTVHWKFYYVFLCEYGILQGTNFAYTTYSYINNEICQCIRAKIPF